MLFNRLWFALFLSNIVVLVVVAAQGYNMTMLFAMAPLLLLFGGFKIYCSKKFDNEMQFYRHSRTLQAAQMEVSSARLGLTATTTPRYCHPAITKQLLRPVIFSTWVEKVQELMHAVQNNVEEKENIGSTSNVTIDETRPSSKFRRRNFRIEFDICGAWHGRYPQKISPIGSQFNGSVNLNEAPSQIRLAELRCLSVSPSERDAERAIDDEDSS